MTVVICKNSPRVFIIVRVSHQRAAILSMTNLTACPETSGKVLMQHLSNDPGWSRGQRNIGGRKDWGTSRNCNKLFFPVKQFLFRLQYSQCCITYHAHFKFLFFLIIVKSNLGSFWQLTWKFIFFLPYRKKITSSCLLACLTANFLSKTSRLRMEQQRAVQECLSTQTVPKIGGQGYSHSGTMFCFHRGQDRSS